MRWQNYQHYSYAAACLANCTYLLYRSAMNCRVKESQRVLETFTRGDCERERVHPRVIDAWCIVLSIISQFFIPSSSIKASLYAC